MSETVREIPGAVGPLEALLADLEISDILVNRYNQVYIERNGRLEESDTVFQSDVHLSRIIERIVSMVGRRIEVSDDGPWVETGSRLVLLAPKPVLGSLQRE